MSGGLRQRPDCEQLDESYPGICKFVELEAHLGRIRAERVLKHRLTSSTK
jgi:hypothetical protein